MEKRCFGSTLLIAATILLVRVNPAPAAPVSECTPEQRAILINESFPQIYDAIFEEGYSLNDDLRFHNLSCDRATSVCKFEAVTTLVAWPGPGPGTHMQPLLLKNAGQFSQKGSRSIIAAFDKAFGETDTDLSFLTCHKHERTKNVECHYRSLLTERSPIASYYPSIKLPISDTKNFHPDSNGQFTIPTYLIPTHGTWDLNNDEAAEFSRLVNRLAIGADEPNFSDPSSPDGLSAKKWTGDLAGVRTSVYTSAISFSPSEADKNYSSHQLYLGCSKIQNNLETRFECSVHAILPTNTTSSKATFVSNVKDWNGVHTNRLYHYPRAFGDNERQLFRQRYLDIVKFLQRREVKIAPKLLEQGYGTLKSVSFNAISEHCRAIDTFREPSCVDENANGKMTEGVDIHFE